MIPNKKTRRRPNSTNPPPAHQQHLAQSSSQQYYAQAVDATHLSYEPSALVASVSERLVQSNDHLNAAVLRRYWPDVLSIISVAPYAVLYVFVPQNQTWEKSGIEGTLFITACTPDDNGTERYRVIVLNRRGLDNFGAELQSPEDVDVTEDYIIIKGDVTTEQFADDEADNGPQIYGLWIFAEAPPSSTAQMRELSAQIIVECASRAAASRKLVAERETERLAQELVRSQPSPGTAEEQSAGGVAMGRQLSLRELFGQQREQDSGFSVHNHHNLHNSVIPEKQEMPPAVPPNKPTTSMFMTNPETDFFRTGTTPSNRGTPANGPNHGGVGLGPSSIAVEDLFRSHQGSR